MARWTVIDGDQVVVIETPGDDQIIVDIPSRKPFITDRGTIADLRRKLGMAIGTANDEQGP